jgi:glycosyltransferase involved in cell wall biosynthesis
LTALSILLFYDCLYPGSVGGVEHRNYELARALGARGHRVVLAGFGTSPERPFPGVEVWPVGPPGRLYTETGKRSTAEAWRLARAAARIDLGGFDVIESANIPYAHLPVLAWRCRRLGKPLLVTWYEHWGRYWQRYLGWKWPLYAAVERLTVPLGTRAIATSRLTAERVEARRGEAVRIVPSGIPVADIRACAGEAVPGSGPPLVYAGRLLREKRIDLLLQAVARLAARWSGGAGPLLAILGEGPDRGRLTELADRLGLGNAVVFHGYLPTNRDVWRRMGASRIAVQPSSREGFGLFPLEAMAAGLPVVHCESTESALGELVEAGVHGLRTAPEPDALAAALAALLADEAEVRRLGANARAQADRFDWLAVAEQTEAVILETLGLSAGKNRRRG